jgi:sec-independent protein translocase protein TatA
MSGGEILVVFLAALILFGGKRLPEIARTVGRTLREFRKAYEEVKRQINIELQEDNTSVPKRPASPNLRQEHDESDKKLSGGAD